MKLESEPALVKLTVLVPAIILLIVSYQWHTILSWTADGVLEPALLSLYATDVAPGDPIEGNVRIDGGLRAAVTSIVAHGPDGTQKLWSAEQPWDDQIEVVTRSYSGVKIPFSLDASDEASFVWWVPESAPTGTELPLELETKFVIAEEQHMGAASFTNEYQTQTFQTSVHIFSKRVSILRRIGKGTLALGSLIGVIVLLVVVSRRYANKPRVLTVSAVILFVPWLSLGWLWFGTLISHATRIHGWMLALPCLLAWCSAPFISRWIRRDDRFATFVAHPKLLPAQEDVAYRSVNVVLPTLSLAEVESILVCQNLAPFRRGHELVVMGGSKWNGNQVRLAIPKDEQFGDGHPIRFRTDDHPFLEEVAAVLGNRLGGLELELVSSSKV